MIERDNPRDARRPRVSVLVSILTLTVISVERYCAISNPLKFKSTLKRARLILLAVWLIAVVTSSPELYFYISVPDDSIPEGVTIFLRSCRAVHRETLFYFYLVTFFIIPIVIMTFSYVRIGRCLWASNIGEITTENSNAVSQLIQRRKIARMLIVVVVCFFGCYLPHYFGSMLINILGTPALSDDVKYTMITIGHLMIYLNSAANPIIYNFMSAKFRKGFVQVCCCCERTTQYDDTELYKRQPLIKISPRQDETKVTLV